MIYGDHDADHIYFEGVDQALQIPGVDIRLFGKPKSFKKEKNGCHISIIKYYGICFGKR